MNDQLQLLDEDYDSSKSQWYTQPDLAERIVKWSLKGTTCSLYILEPSAGLGALIRPIPPRHHVTAYEIDPRRIPHLAELEQVDVVREQDYLNHWAGDRWDLAIMNPPYEDGAAEVHVRKAAMECDRVVALLKASALHGVDRWSLLWKVVRVNRLAILSRRPTFGGFTHGGAKSDYVVIECVLRANPVKQHQPDAATIEWW